jgi:hypothetical protein
MKKMIASNLFLATTFGTVLAMQVTPLLGAADSKPGWEAIERGVRAEIIQRTKIGFLA